MARKVKKNWQHIGLGVAAGAAAMFLAMSVPSVLGQGFVLGGVEVVKGEVCNGNWRMVFSSKYDHGGIVNEDLKVTEQEIAAMVGKGCEFKVLTEAHADRGSWAEKVVKNYQCANVVYRNATSGFNCTASAGVNGQAENLTLDFIDGKVKHNGTENNAVGENVSIKLFVR